MTRTIFNVPTTLCFGSGASFVLSFFNDYSPFNFALGSSLFSMYNLFHQFILYHLIYFVPFTFALYVASIQFNVSELFFCL